MSSRPLPLTNHKSSPLLVVVPSAPIAKDGNKHVLDEKTVSGLNLYLTFWPGPVRCIFRETDLSSLTFERSYSPSELSFEILTLPANALVPDEFICDASIVLASGDNWLDFPIVDQGRKLGIPVCFVIENILLTRLQIIDLSDASFFSKMKSFIWAIIMERKRRSAFAQSKGIQSNGTPAAAAYSGVAPDVLTFFDTRLSERNMATDDEIVNKRNTILNGAPLRLAFSGRLEKLKGADDLIKVAAALDRAGTDFSLDIFGTGSLEPELNAILNDPAAPTSLRNKVRLNGPLDFNSQLVPKMRTEIDLFLCCHRQSDPSCTYLETLGCGVPILGYRNRALAGIMSSADIGWMTRPNAWDEVVQEVTRLNADRSELAKKMNNAREFAVKHSFEDEFKSRIDHLRRIATDARGSPS